MGITKGFTKEDFTEIAAIFDEQISFIKDCDEEDIVMQFFNIETKEWEFIKKKDIAEHLKKHGI